MRMYDLIHKKRFGQELTEQEIQWLVNGYVKGEIPDYQVSAWLMAVCFQGMTPAETVHLTRAMLASGDSYNLSRFGEFTVDKHSTGGVGDKTTLIVAPLVASLGCKVAKLSGRGLGHTGGTIDKLESIVGFSTALSQERFMETVEQCGVCVCGATGNIVPADKMLYALRDVTATVSSVPLIASSIMSKKLAGGAKTIVLDVKVGSGAFMKTLDEAKALAKCMVEIGKDCGRNVSAVITNMDAPLGKCIGNFIEVRESTDLLRNPSAFAETPLYEVCVTLSAEIVSRSKNVDYQRAKEMVLENLHNGNAYRTFIRWIEMQYGDVSLLQEDSTYGTAKYVSEVYAQEEGYITAVNSEGIGICAMMLGAGRASKEDTIDDLAGIKMEVSVGDYVKKGQIVATLYSDTICDHSSVCDRMLENITISANAPEKIGTVLEIIR